MSIGRYCGCDIHASSEIGRLMPSSHPFRTWVCSPWLRQMYTWRFEVTRTQPPSHLLQRMLAIPSDGRGRPPAHGLRRPKRIGVQA